jgi:parvulin-like peptidyl-prolyl isomerase
MNKVGPVVFLATCTGIAGWLYVHERHPATAAPASSASAEPELHEALDAGLDDASLDLELDLADLQDTDAGAAMPDGTRVPELDDAPSSVQFGVVLIEHAGAQGAKTGARSREEADELANELAELAKNDFAAAVKKGDEGSTENAGRMFRGILEPHPDYVLFSLGEGEVSEPVETPRGLWIVKRID